MAADPQKHSSIHPETSLGYVALRVRDLERSIQFYTGPLGLQVLGRKADTASLGSSEHDRVLTLQQDTSAAPRPAGTTGLFHFALLQNSRAGLAHALKRLLDAGYPLEGAADHLVSEAIYLTDPDGNGIELYADRPRDRWVYDEGRLKMATLPLDIPHLIGEAEGTDPSLGQMQLGHVHLNVSDIQASEAFYQEVLGMDLVTRYGPGASFFSAGGYHHHIGVNTWAGSGANAPPDGSLGLRWYTIALVDESDRNRIQERARASGVSVTEDGGLFLTDPAGVRIGLEIA
jgi:catechol 2,3-dioxygenase